MIRVTAGAFVPDGIDEEAFLDALIAWFQANGADFSAAQSEPEENVRDRPLMPVNSKPKHGRNSRAVSG